MCAVAITESTEGFVSILSGGVSAPEGMSSPPAYFSDLNLDQVEAALVKGREGYRLEEFFRVRLSDPRAVRYRQDVFRDLENPEVRGVVEVFAAAMAEVRLRLTRADARYGGHYEQARWFLDAAREYVDAVLRLAADLARSEPDSAGLCGLADFLGGYLDGVGFTRLRTDAGRVADVLARLRYNVWLRGARITVAPYDDEADLSVDIDRTFARFQPGPSEHTAARRPESASQLDPLEERILDQVALVFLEEFAALDGFWRRHDRFVDPVIARFDREVQFYLAWLDLVAPLREAGLTLELPRVSADSKSEVVHGTFDVALARQFVPDGRPVVTNDLSLSGSERIFVITGPNNGGKTTTARVIGQLHHVAALGCPVPGHGVSLFLVDEIYTHFERREDPSALTGKLGEELARFAADFSRATPRSLVIMNEMFSSTSASDALELSLAMLRRVDELDALGVCVTFLDELADFGPKAVSMVCGVDPDDPAIRTFRIARRPADGRAYARALARKYGLSAAQLERRVQA